MLALSFGYLLGGRWSTHDPSTKRLSWLFFGASILLGLAAVIAAPVMQWVFDQQLDPRYGALLASFLLFLPASVVMDMVSPYCVRLSVSNAESSGKTAGVLYFVSTLGSAIGTIMTSFYFVVWLEVNQIITALAVTMLAAGILGFTRAPANAVSVEKAGVA